MDFLAGHVPKKESIEVRHNIFLVGDSVQRTPEINDLLISIDDAK